MAIINNLLIDQGSTFSVTINWTAEDGTYIDLTNYTANSQIRKSYYSANSVTFTANISDAANGEVTLSLTPAQTANLKAGRYVYDLNMSNANVITRLVEGIVTVMPGVTR